MQVGLPDVLINAINPTLEDAEIPLDSVGMVGPEDVFLTAVVDHAAIREGVPVQA